ncbi:ABC transporter [Kineobactrum sediminis]|uniref:ABC transporter n=1 Tax=Kineobactrum sediminis TaxID=1905677 RepID=A0A2N5XYE3_9GAMM|nr:AarF/ABC1/UbiB kinase family protein [Kineobactrum sediminis]PLW81160.1 ABC transporter [Kineobactrum sediminis]
MSKKPAKIRQGSFGRGLSISLAGLRAGSAFAIDNALQRLRGDADAAPEESAFIRREARRFVTELGRLKGTYVKIGQMFALLGEHFLPPALTEALHELEAATEPLPWATIEPHLRASLGARLQELEVEPEALAAASLSQVHRATIRATGENICLKIQYPGLRDVIDSDFDAVVRMLVLARWVRTGRELDAWLESMRTHLHHEIDYLREAQMGDAVAALVAEDTASRKHGRYYVPQRFPRYCRPDVLALEYIDGRLVTHPQVLALSQRRRNALGRNMLELFFHELYSWGILQTDPNFGNYLIRSDGNRDELVLLDFGSTLSCEEPFLKHLGNAIAAGQEQDREALLASLVGLGCLDEKSSDFARDSFSDFCFGLLEPLRPADQLPPEYLNAAGEYCWGRSQLLRRAGKNAASAATSLDFATPSRDFALIARKLTGVFTFISVLDAQFNAHDLVTRHIRRWRKRH